MSLLRIASPTRSKSQSCQCIYTSSDTSLPPPVKKECLALPTPVVPEADKHNTTVPNDKNDKNKCPPKLEALPMELLQMIGDHAQSLELGQVCRDLRSAVDHRVKMQACMNAFYTPVNFAKDQVDPVRQQAQREIQSCSWFDHDFFKQFNDLACHTYIAEVKKAPGRDYVCQDGCPVTAEQIITCRCWQGNSQSISLYLQKRRWW